uniref:Uncharacterized protein n=1 Tax=Rhizobium leguminosarum bv. trifolii TaxID=386 RepID=A0A1C9I125_RHILT|nr:hypothetical protein [Rhizobium leguminosarum bv. trifolii]
MPRQHIQRPQPVRPLDLRRLHHLTLALGRGADLQPHNACRRPLIPLRRRLQRPLVIEHVTDITKRDVGNGDKHPLGGSLHLGKTWR